MAFNLQQLDFSSYNGLINSARQYYEPSSKKDPRSYISIYDTIQKFKKPDWTNLGNEFDTPSVKYFKIFFHFGDLEAYSSSNPGLYSSVFTDAGLLAPTFLLNNTDYKFEPIREGMTDYQYYRFNSAWAYLKNNGEEERAALLQYFIQLLSDVSSNFPWYFQSIEGLDTAVERVISDKEFKIDEDRKKISIKCLPDAFDDRIGTLLDLYRAITWSWSTKRMILPANLRKSTNLSWLY